VTGDDSDSGPALIVTAGARACAIPVRHVSETMRPLPVERVPGGPPFIRGISVIRGGPVPVVDLSALLEGSRNGDVFGRFVTVKVGKRRVALAVDTVVGVRSLGAAEVQQLPPLLQGAQADLIEAIGTLDAQLLVVLRTARLVPHELWEALMPGQVGQ
jgi:purine-binding chemotaxis protein CheW